MYVQLENGHVEGCLQRQRRDAIPAWGDSPKYAQNGIRAIGISTNVQSLTAIKAQNVGTGATHNETTQGGVSSVESGSDTGWLVLVGVYDDLQGSHFADTLTGNQFSNNIYGNGELSGTHDVLGGGKGRNTLIGDSLTKFKPQVGTDIHVKYKTLIDSNPNSIPFATNKKTGMTYSTAPFTEPLAPIIGGSQEQPQPLVLLLSALPGPALIVPEPIIRAVAGLV